jgi:TonB family protein
MASQLIATSVPDRAIRIVIWGLAGLLALAAHVAFAAFLVSGPQEEADEDLGAPGVEVAFVLASPTPSTANLPIGPEAVASAAAPPVVEQATALKEADLPKEVPTEVDDADRVVAVNESKVAEQETPQQQTVAALTTSEAALAQEAMSAPSAPVIAAKSVTVSQGTGESRQRERVSWQKELLAHLNRFKRYPNDRSQRSAEVVITMSLDRTGRVLVAEVGTSSGDSAFDKAAVTMVERASPVPVPPPAVADEGLTFSLPIVFRKNGR